MVILVANPLDEKIPYIRKTPPEGPLHSDFVIFYSRSETFQKI